MSKIAEIKIGKGDITPLHAFVRYAQTKNLKVGSSFRLDNGNMEVPYDAETVYSIAFLRILKGIPEGNRIFGKIRLSDTMPPGWKMRVHKGSGEVFYENNFYNQTNQTFDLPNTVSGIVPVEKCAQYLDTKRVVESVVDGGKE